MTMKKKINNVVLKYDENMLEREESDRVEDIFVPCRDSRAQSVLIKVSGMLKAKNKHWMER